MRFVGVKEKCLYQLDIFFAVYSVSNHMALTLKILDSPKIAGQLPAGWKIVDANLVVDELGRWIGSVRWTWLTAHAAREIEYEYQAEKAVL